MFIQLAEVGIQSHRPWLGARIIGDDQYVQGYRIPGDRKALLNLKTVLNKTLTNLKSQYAVFQTMHTGDKMFIQDLPKADQEAALKYLSTRNMVAQTAVGRGLRSDLSESEQLKFSVDTHSGYAKQPTVENINSNILTTGYNKKSLFTDVKKPNAGTQSASSQNNNPSIKNTGVPTETTTSRSENRIYY